MHISTWQRPSSRVACVAPASESVHLFLDAPNDAGFDFIFFSPFLFLSRRKHGAREANEAKREQKLSNQLFHLLGEVLKGGSTGNR